jgi:hypothetical protein
MYVVTVSTVHTYVQQACGTISAMHPRVHACHMRVFERSVRKEAALIGLMFDHMYQTA